MSRLFLSRGRATVMLIAGALLMLSPPAPGAQEKPAAPAKKPRVEVVFCLDTTGSMGGLIEAAKQKIWAIASQIALGKPTPEVKIGLIPYRDRGDEYITRIIDLSDDLDAIHGELLKFKATGGGDGPESVNQALADAVNKIKWSSDKETLKIIFLVGDAPPHMDYPDDVKYPETCKKAAERGIIINTVQCGGDAECRKYWQDICVKAEGTYVQIAQEGGVVAVATPFDKRLSEINAEMARTTLVFGSHERQAAGLRKADAAAALPAPAAAERASFAGKAGRVAAYDLIDAVREKKVKLEDLKKEELPPQLQKMNPTEQKVFLEQVGKKRAELSSEALELDKKRSEFIHQKLAEASKSGKPATAFDRHVVDTLRKQAEKIHVKY